MKEVEIELIAEDDAYLPIYASEGAAGADVKAYIKDPLTLPAGGHALVPTGLKAAIPPGFEIQVRPRSGLAAKNQVTVLNAPGTIDCDYRGEIQVILINHGKHDFIITPGMRIAQLIVSPVTRGLFRVVEELTSTARGCGGFGHTGSH
jgi:dUTP pyrophosphatase